MLSTLEYKILGHFLSDFDGSLTIKTLIFLSILNINPVYSQVYQTSEISIGNAPIETTVTMQYGITSEILDKARVYYEDLCMLQDANNIRRNLGMPELVECHPNK